jgi:hypothetical protein
MSGEHYRHPDYGNSIWTSAAITESAGHFKQYIQQRTYHLGI